MCFRWQSSRPRSAYLIFGLFGFFFQPEPCFFLTTIQPEQYFSASFSQNSASRTEPKGGLLISTIYAYLAGVKVSSAVVLRALAPLQDMIKSACSLVGFWASLGWLVLVYCKRKILLAGWFGLTETNKRTG